MWVIFLTEHLQTTTIEAFKRRDISYKKEKGLIFEELTYEPGLYLKKKPFSILNGKKLLIGTTSFSQFFIHTAQQVVKQHNFIIYRP